ncbi:MAG: hypothetical protein KGD72_10685 [Candidatus Lokiarchaeota archaeon]|nr:hypothetical protein [Candidatus Lokiarchaeota archaeon]
MLNNLFESFNQARRIFDYDYIFFDSFFLTIWIAIMVKYKKFYLYVLFDKILPWLFVKKRKNSHKQIDNIEIELPV